MEQLIVNSDKGELIVKWSDKESLIQYVTPQRGCYNADLSNINWNYSNAGLKYMPLHDSYFHTKYQELWNQQEELSVFDIPKNSKIIDIGCGSSVIDLLLYSYAPNSTFYLVDKEGEWPQTLHPKTVSFTESHPFYHSWDVVTDAINTSEFDKNRFHFLNPGSNFPEDSDLIMSSASWCWHYSKDQYWAKVMQSLKIGGKLLLDIRLLHDRDIINEISEDLKSQPIMIEIKQLPDYLDVIPTVKPGIVGYKCLWTRNK
jgi:SAM-dependent methyltransferase